MELKYKRVLHGCLICAFFLLNGGCDRRLETNLYSEVIKMRQQRKTLDIEKLHEVSLIGYNVRDFEVVEGEVILFDRITSSILGFKNNLPPSILVKNGPGPMECQLPVSMLRFENGISFVDRTLSSFKTLLNDTTLRHLMKINNDISDAVVISDSSFVVSHSSPGFTLGLSHYKIDNDKWVEESIRSTDFEEHGATISHDGFLAISSCGNVAYAPYLISKFYNIQSINIAENKEVVSYPLIYTLPEPEVYVDETSAMALESTIHLVDIDVSCNIFYALNVISDVEDAIYIDLYGLKAGSYFGSYKLPIINDIDRPKSFRVNPSIGELYVLYEEKIVVYKTNGTGG